MYYECCCGMRQHNIPCLHVLWVLLQHTATIHTMSTRVMSVVNCCCNMRQHYIPCLHVLWVLLRDAALHTMSTRIMSVVATCGSITYHVYMYYECCKLLLQHVAALHTMSTCIVSVVATHGNITYHVYTYYGCCCDRKLVRQNCRRSRCRCHISRRTEYSACCRTWTDYLHIGVPLEK